MARGRGCAAAHGCEARRRPRAAGGACGALPAGGLEGWSLKTARGRGRPTCVAMTHFMPFLYDTRPLNSAAT
jgi:hypothetical protein